LEDAVVVVIEGVVCDGVVGGVNEVDAVAGVAEDVVGNGIVV